MKHPTRTRCSDRLFLAVSATLATSVGSVIALQARSLPDRYQRPELAPSATLTAAERAGSIAAAIDHSQREFAWTDPAPRVAGRKPAALLRSNPLLIKDGKLYDLSDPNTPALRPPMSNAYLESHRLPAGRSDVALLDLDGDGFTNAEEFLAGQTDPRDAADHPPFTDKLHLARVETDQFSLTFTGGDLRPGFNVRETQQPFGEDRPTKKNHNTAIGKSFGKLRPDRWQVVDFLKREVVNPNTGASRDASELFVRDLSQPAAAPLKLIVGEPLPLPTHRAVFRFDLPGHEGELSARPSIGDSFELPVEPGVRYEILELGATADAGAVVSRGSETISIRP